MVVLNSVNPCDGGSDETVGPVVRAWSAVLMASIARAAEPVPVLILDGESGGPYHDWPRVTAVLERILGEVGLLMVSIATAPPAGGDFAAFSPTFSRTRRRAELRRA